jgi:hypothetical protein
MNVSVTLTSDEYAILSEVPGRSAQQRIRWLVRFFGACIDEKKQREKVEAEVDAAKEQAELDSEYPDDIVYEDDPCDIDAAKVAP